MTKLIKIAAALAILAGPTVVADGAGAPAEARATMRTCTVTASGMLACKTIFLKSQR